MKTIIILYFLILLSATGIFAQVSINKDGSLPDVSAVLDLKCTDKGLLIPRLTTKQREGISNPGESLIVFDSEDMVFYYHNSFDWIPVGSGSNASGWTFNADTIYRIVGTDTLLTIKGNDYIGIGTASPEAKLEVSGGNFNTDENIILDDNYLSGDGDDEGIVVDNSGRVGIGRYPLEQNLEVANSFSIFTNDQPGFYFHHARNRYIKLKYDRRNFLRIDQEEDDDGVKFINDNDTELFFVNFAEDRCLIPNGNVGLGAITPDYKLQIDGDMTPEANNTSNLGSSNLRWDTLFMASIIDYSNNLSFSSGGNEYFTYTTTGDVGINKTNPDEKFEIEFGDAAKDVEFGVGTTDTDITFFTLRSPNGTKYYITTDDSGNFSASTTKP